MTSWAVEKTREENDRYFAGVVEISEMVDQGRLSSTAAREVFSEFHDGHVQNLKYIEQIDAMEVGDAS